MVVAFNGRTPARPCGEPTVEGLREAAQAATDWIVRNQNQRRGEYLYDYKADGRPHDPRNEAYNDTRHAALTAVLYDAASRLNDPNALQAADLAVTWMTRRFETRHGWSALHRDQDLAKLGTSALMVVALAERRSITGDASRDEVMRALGRFIRALQRPDGSFQIVWYLDDDSPEKKGTEPFYPGEALWALTLLDKALPGEGWGEAAGRAADYISIKRDVQENYFQPDQWAAYGLAELGAVGLSRNEELYVRALVGRMHDALGDEVIDTSKLPRTVEGDTEIGPAVTATRVEGLAAVWRLASTYAPLADLQSRTRPDVLCGAEYLIERQTRDASEGYSDPKAALGAWFNAGQTRMDFQQHTLAAVLAALDVLEGRTLRTPQPLT